MSVDACLVISPILCGLVAEQLPLAHPREAWVVYERTAEAARQDYIAVLSKAKLQAMQERKPELAATVDAEIRRVSAQALHGEVAYRDYLPRPEGDWTIRYSNGYTRHYIFHVNGTVEFGDWVSIPQERPDSFLLQFDDGKLERWIPMADGRFHVEHYSPSLNDACIGAGHHRACLGGTVTDSQNVRPPSCFRSAGGGFPGGSPPGGTEMGLGRAFCCQSWPHRHEAGGGLAAR